MGIRGDAKPNVRLHAPLSGIGGLLQCASISLCQSSYLLSGIKRCPLFRSSVCISYIHVGVLAGAKVGIKFGGWAKNHHCKNIGGFKV